MIRLMRANLFRLFKSRVFRVCVAISPALDLLSLILELGGNVPFRRAQVPLEPNVFGNVPNIAFFLAVFAGLFLGTEYSDGGLRNKLIVGQSRAAVCLSELLTCIAAGLMFFAAQFSTELAIGLARGYRQTVPTGEIVSRVLICIGAFAALSALFTLLGALVSGKSSCVTAAICLTMAMLIGSAMILSELAEPEYLTPMRVTYPDEIGENGEPRTEILTEKNPNYPVGLKRQTLETLNDLLPTGQLLRMGMSGGETIVAQADDSAPSGFSFETAEKDTGSFAERAAPMIGYSLGIVLLTTSAGLLVFRKKDIR